MKKVFSLILFLAFTLSINAIHIVFDIKMVAIAEDFKPVDRMSGWMMNSNGPMELAIFHKGECIARHKIKLSSGVSEKGVAKFKSTYTIKVVRPKENTWDRDIIDYVEKEGIVYVSEEVFEKGNGKFVLGIKEEDESFLVTGTYNCY